MVTRQAGERRLCRGVQRTIIPSVRFSLLRVPVLVQPLFWIGAIFLGLFAFNDLPEGLRLQAMMVWVPIMFFAVLVHEMGHALMGRRFGLDPEVHLLMLGGRTTWSTGRRLTPGRSIAVSFAGPAVGLVLGGGLYFALPYMPPLNHPLLEVAAFSFIWTNLGWAIFNLVPIVGLDGGNIMAATFEKFGGARGVRVAHVLSIFIAAALATFFLTSGNFFMAIMLGFMAFENYQRWQLSAHWQEGMQRGGPKRPSTPTPKIAAHSVPLNPTQTEPGDERAVEADIQKAYEALEDENHASVRRIAESLIPKIRTDAHRFDVAHLVAWGRLLTGDPVGAERALRQLLPLGRRPDALLEGSLLLDLGRPEDALAPLSEALAGRSDDFVASRVARAATGAREITPVLGALRKAKADSAPRPYQIIVSELMREGQPKAAAELGEALFDRYGVGTDAFNVACARARSGQFDEAMVWLDKALGAGLPDPKVLLEDEDLREVRERPEFEALRERVTSSTAAS
jgi:Zn-dependent protease